MIAVRIFFTLLILVPLVIGLKNRIQFRGFVKSMPGVKFALINSSVHFAIAFNLIFFLQELFLVLGKKYLGLTSFLFHNNHNWEGSHEMERLMQGSGALAILIFGVLFLILYISIRKSRSQWKVLVLWLAFHGFFQSVPQVMVAYFEPRTDVGQALMDYLGFPMSMMAVFAILSMICMVILATLFGRYFLELSPMSLNKREKLIHIRSYMAGAALIGCILVIPFRILPWSQIIAPFLVVVFSIPWSWSTAPYWKFKSYPSRINDQLYPGPIILLIVLLLIFRLILAPGIRF